MPLMFWKVSCIVFFGFSGGKMLPIHEVGVCIRLFVDFFLATLLFSVLVFRRSAKLGVVSNEDI